MWENGEAPQEGDSGECRLFVVLANHASDPKRAFGPYRVVQVTADSVWACSSSRPQRIARKMTDGSWEIAEGTGQAATFRGLLVLCPPEGTTATQLEQRLGPSGEQ